VINATGCIYRPVHQQPPQSGCCREADEQSFWPIRQPAATGPGGISALKSAPIHARSATEAPLGSVKANGLLANSDTSSDRSGHSIRPNTHLSGSHANAVHKLEHLHTGRKGTALRPTKHNVSYLAYYEPLSVCGTRYPIRRVVPRPASPDIRPGTGFVTLDSCCCIQCHKQTAEGVSDPPRYRSTTPTYETIRASPTNQAHGGATPSGDIAALPRHNQCVAGQDMHKPVSLSGLSRTD